MSKEYCMCVVQEQYKYCFKVLWDYRKCEKTKDDSNKRRALSSSRRTDRRSKLQDPSDRMSAETANSAQAGVSQAVGQSFRTAMAVQGIGTGRNQALSGFAEIELSNNMSSIT